MRRALLVLASVAILLPACQSALPATGGGPTTPLAAADAKFFSGDYDGAEAAYLKLTDSGDPTVLAHYALLLDYENRFTEAIATARSATSSGTGSRTYAALTRALDWSEDVTAAVAAGSKAVKATPVDPLAHAFFSEALADSGSFAASRAQLLAAEKTANDSYTVSEAEREWGNYYRAQGDTLEELNHLQLSLRAQPGFPERSLELARYDYDASKADDARKLLSDLGRKHPNDYAVSVAVADTAFLHSDMATAETFYQGALKVRPAGPAASLGEAELLVAGKRDFQGAHDLVLASLKANPSTDDLYYFLYYLDQLVLKIDPQQDLASIPPLHRPNEGASPAGQALERVNAFRATVNLPALTASGPLTQAATAHAYFWLFNFGQAAVAGLKVHDEDPSLPGAFGADVLTRDKYFGYTGAAAAEVVSHVYEPSAAVDHWVDSVFHRYPLDDPATVGAGYGQAQVGALSIQVMDLAVSPAAAHDPLVYPVPDQRNVPAAFLGNEIPDPAPTARYPTGYPITIQAAAGTTLKITSAELIGPDGADRNGYVVDSTTGNVSANEWAVLPRDPFLPGSRYTVKIDGTVDGAPFAKSWTFDVAPPA